MALGASFCNAKGEELSLGGGALADLSSIDLRGFDKCLLDIEITVACDVTNPYACQGKRGSGICFWSCIVP